jgi:hypothetical protein
MRVHALLVFCVACGSATDTPPVRYNFGIVDGRDQRSTAGAAQLAKSVTTQLTRDPQGEFASRVLDFFKPVVAYAQSLSLAGDPVANAIVCGRESAPGEPKVVPLCAYTLADGKAANIVEGGTKAGTYTILFTAQVPSQAPVVDSTTVTVDPGAADTVIAAVAGWLFVGEGKGIQLSQLVIHAADRYGNLVTSSPTVTDVGKWSVANGVISSSSEQSAPITLAVDTKPATVSLVSVVDLRPGLAATGKCTGLVGVSNDAGVPIDSSYFDLVSPTLTYPVGSTPNPKAVFSGTVHHFAHDGTDEIRSVSGIDRSFQQRPDTLLMGGTAVRNGASTYVEALAPGSKYCWLFSLPGANGTVTFTAR